MLVDTALGSSAEDDVATEETGDEGVCGALLVVVEVGERVHGSFVEGDEESEVLGVRACGGEHCGKLFSKAGAGERALGGGGGGRGGNLRSVAEEEYHHQCVWEAHFGTVYQAVSEALDDGENVMVFGVKDEPVYGRLVGVRLAVVSEGVFARGRGLGVHQDNIHGAGHLRWVEVVGWGGGGWWCTVGCASQKEVGGSDRRYYVCPAVARVGNRA